MQMTIPNYSQLHVHCDIFKTGRFYVIVLAMCLSTEGQRGKNKPFH